MITLEQNRLCFRFPEVHADALLRIDFQRTLRVPDDNREYRLPAGLGRFPVRHVDDYADVLPPAWKQHGGVMLPMYQAEALWLNFSAEYPMALKISAGKINAVTGDTFSNELGSHPQDYLVVPDQPWLDGFNAGKGMVRQFVAMPLGEGFTAEEQLTGKAEHGGIQIVCYPMRRDVYEALQAKRATRRMEPQVCRSEPVMEMGLAPGGMIRQQIHEDDHGIEAWDTTGVSRCFVHLANSLHWRQITSQVPPQSPVTKEQYETYGMPWFEYYFSDAKALQASDVLGGLDSVASKAIKKRPTKRFGSNSVGAKSKVDFEGIQLNVDWRPDSGVSVDELPALPGIYAEIHWPQFGVRVGETGDSIRTKIRHDIRWFNSMWEGSAPPEQLRRTIPIAETAKEFGATAFEFYVVSIDPRLSDKALRQECERYMFRWLEQHPKFVSWNHQRSWR